MFRSKKDKGPQPDPAPEEQPRTNAFLGTLRSEFDEPETLPRGFAELRANVDRLLNAYEDGRLSRTELADRLARQRASDSDGGEWTIGATSRDWYRRPGGRGAWLQAPAPSQAIGEPRPGTWQNPLDIPERVETPEPETVLVLTREPSLTDPPAAGMQFPDEYVPGGMASDSGAISYSDKFDAGLAALLGEDTTPHTPDAEKPKEQAEEGPARRMGKGPSAGTPDLFGSGYLDEGPEEISPYADLFGDNSDTGPSDTDRTPEEDFFLPDDLFRTDDDKD